MSEITKQAIEKIDVESKEFKGTGKANAVKSHVARTLKGFCKDEAFAERVVGSEKTLTECCTEIMKKVGGHVPDIEVYRRAAKFYFPNASVDFNMTIKLDGAPMEVEQAPVVRGGAPKKTVKKDNKDDVIQISLF